VREWFSDHTHRNQKTRAGRFLQAVLSSRQDRVVSTEVVLWLGGIGRPW
jgi:hypothetical protein